MDNLQIDYEQIQIEIQNLISLKETCSQGKVNSPIIEGQGDVVYKIEMLIQQYEALSEVFVDLIDNSISLITKIMNQAVDLDQEIAGEIDVSE